MPRRYEPARNLYWALVNGTTESRPWRTSGESANSEVDFICARDTGLGRGLPALILTWGLLGSEASAETTVAVPMALFSSPVWYMTRRSLGCMPRMLRRATGLETPSQMVALSFCRSAKEYVEGSVFKR